MDQVYLPKNRVGMEAGSFVVVRLLSSDNLQNNTPKPQFYGINYLEPIKIEIINRIFKLFSAHKHIENIIITGSFLENGFNFNDIDALIVSESKINEKVIMEEIKVKFGLKLHVIVLNSRELYEGRATDPLYENMLSKCVSLKKIVFNVRRKINLQILDLHLLKSKTLLDNFDILNGKEKYYLVKNLISILLFIKGKKISNEVIEQAIKFEFKVDSSKIKENMLDKSSFIKKFRELYCFAEKSIFSEAKNDSK